MSKTIGVLALQGGYESHLRALGRCGYRTRAIRRVDALTGIDGLVYPVVKARPKSS